MMKIFVLLLVAMMTGCEATSEDSSEDSSEDIDMMGCSGGWVDFTCRYPDVNTSYEAVYVKCGDETVIESNLTASWKSQNRFHLYHDRTNKNLRVIIRQLQSNDFKKWKCGFDQHDSDQEVDLKREDSYETPFNQIAYKTAKTTITCEYPNKSNVKFFCKDNGFICEDILSEPPLRSNGTFSLNITGLIVSISNVSTQHLGDYWCGLKSKDGISRAGLKKIHLNVEDITTSELSLAVGQTSTFRCDYPESSSIFRFFCKGEDPSSCQTLISKQGSRRSTGRFSLKEDHRKKQINITVTGVTAEDTGTYWCGTKNSGSKTDKFYHRFLVTVVPKSQEEEVWLLPVISAVVVCLVVVLIIILVLVYKRCKRSETWRDGGALEEQAYAEIQERPPLPTIYATANFPSISSAPPGYSVVTFKNSSDVKGDAYSTVRHPDPSPVYSTVNHTCPHCL
nr:polymeric immunoglobulin receptor-like [Labrus bergylta]